MSTSDMATAAAASTPTSTDRPTARVNPTGRIRRIGWGVADQALSSLTNFALAVTVAHESAPQGFGLFALLFAAYCVVLGVCRAICCEPLTVRFSDTSSGVWRRGASLATGSALLIGLMSSIVCVAAGVCSGPRYGGMIVVFGLAIPALLLQDTWRFAFSSSIRSQSMLIHGTTPCTPRFSSRCC